MPGRPDRWLAGLAMGLLALATPAMAGDRASLDAIGYSQDGRYFAFAEYGVQDGSGFPFANVYAVDLKTDSWVAGTPVRVLLQDEAASFLDARYRALDQAKGVLETIALATPAEFAALIGDGAPGVDGHALDFAGPVYGGFGSMTDEHYRLELTNFAVAEPGRCADYDLSDTMGFVLTLSGDGPARELHRDGKSLPSSRGCATDYALYAVAYPSGGGLAMSGAVAIISVYTVGFEGPNRRFMAVPIDF